MNRALLRKARGCLLRFAFVYCLLLLPWPGLAEAGGSWFRLLGRACLGAETGQRVLDFQKGDAQQGATVTRIEIVNRALMAGDGSGPVRNLDVSTGAFWKSTALLLALILATPVAWPRRIRALLWGVLAMHAFILLSVALAIWVDSRHVGLVSLTPFWEGVADSFQHALISQLSIAVPVLIWVVTTLRGQEVEALVSAARRNEG